MQSKKIRNPSKRSRFQAFTLVELIVTIAILAILGTIWFMSVGWFQSKARDGDRVSAVKNLTTSLSLYQIAAWAYPLPDVPTSGAVFSGSIFGIEYSHLGIIGNNNARLLRLDKAFVDPLEKTGYPYGVTSDRKYYQIATVLENSHALLLPSIVDTAYAASYSYRANVQGNYPGYLKFTDGSGALWMANIPSLIWANTGSVNLLSPANYFVVDGKSNLPYNIAGESRIRDVLADAMLVDMTKSATSTLTGVSLSGVTQANFASVFTGALLTSFNIGGSSSDSNTIRKTLEQLVFATSTSSAGGGSSDTTPPAGGDFTINSGAATVTGTSVTLNITCPVDAGNSNPIQMAYGNATTPTNWTACTASTAHTLVSGAGAKTVYVRFKDSLGNTTADITKSITIVLANYLVMAQATGTYVVCGGDYYYHANSRYTCPAGYRLPTGEAEYNQYSSTLWSTYTHRGARDASCNVINTGNCCNETRQMFWANDAANAYKYYLSSGPSASIFGWIEGETNSHLGANAYVPKFCIQI